MILIIDLNYLTTNSLFWRNYQRDKQIFLIASFSNYCLIKKTILGNLTALLFNMIICKKIDDNVQCFENPNNYLDSACYVTEFDMPFSRLGELSPC